MSRPRGGLQTDTGKNRKITVLSENWRAGGLEPSGSSVVMQEKWTCISFSRGPFTDSWTSSLNSVISHSLRCASLSTRSPSTCYLFWAKGGDRGAGSVEGSRTALEMEGSILNVSFLSECICDWSAGWLLGQSEHQKPTLKLELVILKFNGVNKMCKITNTFLENRNQSARDSTR